MTKLLGGFWIGLHHPSMCRYFDRAFVSVNTLWKRKSGFTRNPWIMDSGAFSELNNYGRYRYTTRKYANAIKSWALTKCLTAAVTQDYMCEPHVLNKTGLSIPEHQRLTIERYDSLLGHDLPVYLMPVLQGYRPIEYVQHLEMYGTRLANGAWVGVGSVCKRNSSPLDVYYVLDFIKSKRPDLKIHGFGLKTTALSYGRVLNLLHSADSMAWSMAARRDGKNANGLDEAIEFHDKIQGIIGPRQ